MARYGARGRAPRLPPVTRPDPFPQNSLSATRAATYGMDQDWLVPFSKAVYESAFARGQSIAEPPAVVALLNGLGHGRDHHP